MQQARKAAAAAYGILKAAAVNLSPPPGSFVPAPSLDSGEKRGGAEGGSIPLY